MPSEKKEKGKRKKEKRRGACLSQFVFPFSFLLFPSISLANFSFLHDNHTYLLVRQNKTWLNAAIDARSRSVAGSTGYLAIIDSAAENQAIFSNLLANIPASEFNNTRAPDGGNGVYVYIGATDRITEGTWIWEADGDSTGPAFWQGTGAAGGIVGGLYNNWGHYPTPTAQWEPDNAAGGLQDAAGIGLANWPRGFAGEWNDIRADNSLYYLVEFSAVPEPSAITSVAVASALLLARRRRIPAVIPLD